MSARDGLQAFAGIAGWVFLTLAVARIVRPDVVYLASAGLFCLSLFGWQFLYTIARKGLYSMSRKR